MLMLTRRPGESVIIKTNQGDIIVKYMGPRGGAASLGFEAPQEIAIHRDDCVDKEPRHGRKS